MQLDLDSPPQQFAGGFANLNYLIKLGRSTGRAASTTERSAAGRRATIWRASFKFFRDCGRNFRWRRAVCICVRMLVSSARRFRSSSIEPAFHYESRCPPRSPATSAVGATLGNTLADILIDLHRVDPASVGLETLGKPSGFLQRATEGWIKRASVAVDGWGTPTTLQLIIELAHWLREHCVPDASPRLLHNDFKLDNVLLDPVTLAPLAVLDWDQGTRGDGLFDLAVLLSYWTEPGDPPAMHQMAQMPTASAGFPSRRRGCLSVNMRRRSVVIYRRFGFIACSRRCGPP